MRYKNDFTKFIKNNMKGMVEIHLEAWEKRYFNYDPSELEYDLSVNHDPSLEVEYAENELKRKLSNKEYDYLIFKFNENVVRRFKHLSLKI